MSKYLLEIGTEELPANFSHSVLDQFKSQIEYELEKKLIKFKNVFCTSTPRRIVVLLEGLVDFADDKKILRKGPKAISAFSNGEPTKAALGFANSLGINVEDLEVMKTEKGDFVFGMNVEKGVSTKDALSLIIPQVINKIQGPRFMKWGYGSFKFSRPIRWIVSLYNNEILDFTLKEIDPSIVICNKTKSHRLFNRDIELKDIDDYFRLMNNNGVLVQRKERKERIKSLIYKSSLSLNLEPDLSEGLLNELTDLVESPSLILGKFDKKFLDIPAELLSTVMQNHQRYIPLLHKNKSFSKLELSSEKIISTNFIIISNGLEESNNIIARGNEKVLKARFSDAKFFIESDLKIPSDMRNEKLKFVSYLKGMGNVFQRVERIEIIAEKIFNCVNYDSLDRKKVIESARYSKNDLCSDIVFEFPELQGIMGGKYLKNEGFSEEVSLAVAEHYLPSSFKDSLPSSLYGAIISISDKIETLISIFISGKRPSGSSDPYALRRNLNGVIKIIWEFNLDLSLDDIYDELLESWKTSLPDLKFSKEKVLSDLIEFSVQRILIHLEDTSKDKELIKAIYPSEEYSVKRIFNLIDLKNRMKSILFFKEKGRFFEIQKVISRVCKLANNGNLENNIFTSKDYVNPDLFEKVCESKVFSLVKELELYFSKNNCDYLKLLNLFESNKSNIEDFFDNEKGVLVMSDNTNIRNNRLNLLGLIRNYSLKIADFTLLNS